MSTGAKKFSAREVELMKWLSDAQLIAQRAQENAERAFDPVAKAAHLARFNALAEVREQLRTLQNSDNEGAT